MIGPLNGEFGDQPFLGKGELWQNIESLEHVWLTEKKGGTVAKYRIIGA